MVILDKLTYCGRCYVTRNKRVKVEGSSTEWKLYTLNNFIGLYKNCYFTYSWASSIDKRNLIGKKFKKCLQRGTTYSLYKRVSVFNTSLFKQDITIFDWLVFEGG